MSCISKSTTVIVLGNLSTPTLFRRRPPIRCKSKKSSKKQECKGPKKPLIDLQCKVALITGGAEGIGLAIAHQILGQKMKGIGIVGLNTCQGRDTVNKLNCCYGKNKAMFVRADIACPSQLAETFKKVKEEYGRLDVVVNCAGILNGKEWEKELSTNLVATIHSTLISYKNLSKDSSSSGGVILNISGTHGLQPLPPAPTLCSNYHGIVGVSRSFGDSLNFKRTGVRVVCLCPGITHSNFFKDAKNKVLEPAMFKDLQTVFRMSKQQKTDVCGKAALHVLLHGPSGSVWVVEGSKLYSLKIPNWKDYSRLVSQFI